MLNKLTIKLLEKHLNTHITDVTKINQEANTIPYLVNKKYIVREARIPKLQNKLLKEERLLNFLKGKLTLKIPHVSLLDTGNRFYACHEMIYGDRLEAEDYNALHEDEKNSFIKTLAEFLAELHQQPIPSFLPKWDQLERISKKCTLSVFEDTVLLAPEFKPSEKEYLSSFFKNYITKYQKEIPAQMADYVLGHCDVLPKNVAYDFKNKVLNGIFDFGNSGKIHREHEFMYIAIDWPVDVLKRLYPVYNKLSGKSFNIKNVLDHALFFRICLYIGKQLGGGLEHIDDYAPKLQEMLQKHNDYTQAAELL